MAFNKIMSIIDNILTVIIIVKYTQYYSTIDDMNIIIVVLSYYCFQSSRSDASKLILELNHACNFFGSAFNFTNGSALNFLNVDIHVLIPAVGVVVMRAVGR